MAAATGVAPKTDVPFPTIKAGTFTLDPGSIAAGASEEQTVAVPEAKVGDSVIVSSRTVLVDGLVGPINPRVSADGTISFWLENNHSAALDQGTGTWDYTLIRGNLGAAGVG